MADNTLKEYSTRIDELNATLKKMNDEVKNTESAIDTLNKAYDAGQISQKEYKKASEELNKSLEKSKKNLSQNVGVFKDFKNKLSDASKNLGVLGGAFGQASGAIVGVTGNIGGLLNSFKAIVTNPVGLTLTLLATLFFKVKSAIEGNEEHSNKLQRIMAKFEPIGVAISKAFDLVAEKILGAVESIMDFIYNIDKFMGKVVDLNAKFNPFFIAIDKVYKMIKGENASLAEDLKGVYNKVAEAGRKFIDKETAQTTNVVKMEQALTKAKRDSVTQINELEDEQQRIQNKLADRTKLSYKEQEELIKRAGDIRVKVAKINEDIARKEYNLIVAKNNVTASSTKDLDAQSAAEKRLGDATRATSGAIKEAGEQLRTIRNEAKAAAKALSDLERSLNTEYRKAEVNIMNEGIEKIKARYELEREMIKVNAEAKKAELKEEQQAERELIDKTTELQLKEQDMKEKMDMAKYNRDQTLSKEEYQQKLRDIQAEMLAHDTELAAAQNKFDTLRELENQRHEQALENIEREKQADIDGLNEKLAEGTISQETYNENLMAINELYAEKEVEANRTNSEKKQEIEKQEADQKIQIQQKAYNAVGSMMGNLSKIAKEGSDLQMALQMGEIIMTQAVAMAQAISKATSTSSSWIEMLAAIAASVGAVVGTFVQVKNVAAQAKQARKQKYATGGLVSGPGSGTSDSIDAKLSNGEYVMPAAQTKMYLPLLESMRGTSNSATPDMYSIISAALMNMPTPQVSVIDINDQQDNVQDYSNFSKL